MRVTRVTRALAVATAAVIGTAHAQPAKTPADDWFDRGKQLMTAGKTQEACAAFDESQRHDPATETVLNQANCRERNGQLATARMLFLEAVRQTTAGTDRRSRQMRTTATDRAASLESRVSRLRIDVAPGSGPGLEVLRDGEPVDPASWNTAVPIDGGTYRISARAPGRAAWSTVVAVGAERDTRIVDVPVLPAAHDQPALRSDEQPSPATPLVLGDRRWTAKRKLAVGLAAGGAASLATAGALGLLARQRQRDTHALCPDPRIACDDADRAGDLSRSAHNLAIGANIAFGVAAGAATAAVVLWLTGAPGSDRGVALAPSIAPGRLVVTASRSW